MSLIRSSIGRRTSSGTAAAAALEIIAGARALFVREVVIALAAATASTFGLGRPAAKGITPTSPVTSLSEQPGDAVSTATTAVAWGTGPTVPADFFRRVGFPAVIGSTITWYFNNGLFIPASGSLVIWNIGTNGVCDVTFVTEEQGPSI